jgi:hypothetical protein
MEHARRCFGITVTGKIHNLDIHRCRRTGDWRFYCHEHWKQPIYFLAVGILLIVGKVADFSTVINLIKPSTVVQAPSPIPELTQPPLVQTPITGEEQPPIAALEPSPPPDLQQSPPAQILIADREQPVQAASPFKSFEAYCNKLKDLEDRFYERDEFIKYMTGKEIEWTGYVISVSRSSESGTMILFIVPSLDITANCRAFFRFSEQPIQTKLYSLRKNDRIQVTGV